MITIAVPIAKIDSDHTFINRQGEFVTIQLTIPKNELGSDNGVMEIHFTGGPKDTKTLRLVADYKSSSPMMAIIKN